MNHPLVITSPGLNPDAASWMERPKYFRVDATRFACTHTVPYCIEYVMLTAERALSPLEIRGFLLREFRVKVHASNMSNYMKEWLRAGKVAKLARGLYVHVAYLPKYPGQSVEDDELPDIFS